MKSIFTTCLLLVWGLSVSAQSFRGNFFKVRNSLKFRKTIPSARISAGEKMKLDSAIIWASEIGTPLEKYQKYEAFYNENGTPTGATDYSWSESLNDWKVARNEEYFYNESGILISMTYKDFVTEDEYLPSYRHEYKYNTEGLINEEFVFELNQSGIWDSVSIKKSTYNPDGKIQEIINYSKGGDVSNWSVPTKELYSYDKETNTEIVKTYTWDPLTSEWMGESNKSKKIYDFGYINFPDTIIEYHWENDGWKEDRKDINIYDETTGLLTMKGFWWDDQLSVWESTSIITVKYDKNYTSGDLLFPPLDMEYNYFFHMMKESVIEETMVDGKLEIRQMDTLYFSPLNITSIEKEKHHSFLHIGPNPATSEIVFSTDIEVNDIRIEIYNLQGKQVLNRSVNKNEPVGVSDLLQGMYVVKILENNSEVAVEKIIIQK